MGRFLDVVGCWMLDARCSSQFYYFLTTTILTKRFAKTQEVFQFDLEMNNNIYCMHLISEKIAGSPSGPLAIINFI